MPDSAGSELKVGRLYQSSEGNLWRVVAILPGGRVRVSFESPGHGKGTTFVWHHSSCADLTPVAEGGK